MNRLDQVPWVHRSDIRHKLKEAGEHCYQLRDDMPAGHLNLDGAIEDVDRIILDLAMIRSTLNRFRS